MTLLFYFCEFSLTKMSRKHEKHKCNFHVFYHLKKSAT